MSIYNEWKYVENRLKELQTFFDGFKIKGLHKVTINGVFQYILSK